MGQDTPPPPSMGKTSSRLIIVISSGHALNPLTCPSNKCDGCFYLQPFNKPDLAAQQCFALYLHKSSQISDVDENGEEVKIFVSLKAQGRRFHLLDNWGSNKKITRVPNSGILPRHYTRPAHQSNCSAEAKKLLCRHATCYIITGQIFQIPENSVL